MSPDITRFGRRNVLQAISAAGATAALGGAALLATSGTATAASGTLSISGSSVSNDQGDLTQVHVDLSHEATWDGFDYPVEAAEYRDVIRVQDADGNQLGSTVLRDETDTPKMLANWSGQGDSDGWAGDDEYTSGPGTEGSVNAGIVWTVLLESGVSPQYNIPQGSPGTIDNYGLDNETDDSSTTYTVEFVKVVQFYTSDPNGSYTSDDGTSLRLLGGDDGTIGQVEASGTFGLTVTNEGATTGGNGSGASTAE